MDVLARKLDDLIVKAMASARIRREGFAGQHLVVVPPPVRRSLAAHPLLRGLMVTDAGFFPTAVGHCVDRPQGAATHLLMICLKGEGWVKSNGRFAPVRAGAAVWLPADVPHAYGAAERDPWTLVWAHFAGEEAAHWRSELGLPAKPAFALLDFSHLGTPSLGLDRVYAALENGYSHRHLLAASAALRVTLSALIEAVQKGGPVRSAAQRTAAVRDEMAENPSRSYRLDELAAGAGLSVPHFSLLFRKQTGYAPIDFLIRQRIRAACRLIDTTERTLSSIAAEVGFDDPYYFSRCFRRIMGSSPRDYRKSVRG